MRHSYKRQVEGTHPEKISTALEAAAASTPAFAWAINVGASPRWKSAISHSDSSCPLLGPSVHIPWQHTMTRFMLLWCMVLVLGQS